MAGTGESAAGICGMAVGCTCDRALTDSCACVCVENGLGLGVRGALPGALAPALTESRPGVWDVAAVKETSLGGGGGYSGGALGGRVVGAGGGEGLVPGWFGDGRREAWCSWCWCLKIGS